MNGRKCHSFITDSEKKKSLCCTTTTKAKAKARDSYIARVTGTKPDQPRFTIIGSGS